MNQVDPQSLVEHALATSRSEHCVVIVEDATGANLRWANNTLTTNGVVHDIGVTVIAFQGARLDTLDALLRQEVSRTR